jgi:hypothetical protein
MWKDFEATGIGISLGLMIFLIVNVAIGRDILPRAERNFEPIEVPVLDLNPDSLFSNNCAMCHQADGQGLPGQFPPLAGSSWVTQDPETPIRVMLLGISGEIEVNGNTFNGVMPSQSHLNDEQIALLATKIRSSWGNEAPEVTEEQVAEIRASLAGRTNALGGGAELSALRGQ